jgi:hypothetical protein
MLFPCSQPETLQSLVALDLSYATLFQKNFQVKQFISTIEKGERRRNDYRWYLVLGTAIFNSNEAGN